MLQILTIGLSAFLMLFGPIAIAGYMKAEAVAELVIKQCKVKGKNGFRATEEQIVELQWSTDEDVALRLHGYNVVMKTKSGTPRVMCFKAHTTDRYPATAHGLGGKLVHNGGLSEKSKLCIEIYPR